MASQGVTQIRQLLALMGVLSIFTLGCDKILLKNAPVLGRTLPESSQSDQTSQSVQSSLSSPAPIQSVQVSAVPLSGSVYLKWSYPSPPPQSVVYTIVRGTSLDSGVAIASGISDTHYTDHTVANGTTYYYQVQGVSSSGVTIRSTSASASPAASLCNPDSGASTFGGGSGSAFDPYLICAFEHLDNLRNFLTANQYYKMAVDIDLAGKTLEPIGVAQTSPFRGTFDGAGFTLSNWHYVVPFDASWVGLFGGYIGTLKNLRIIDSGVEGEEDPEVPGVPGRLTYAALLVGTAGSITLSNVIATGIRIRGSSSILVGGLIALCGTCDISDTMIAGEIVTNWADLAGFVGQPNMGGLTSISNSYSLMEIKAPDGSAGTVGGLVGRPSNASVSITNSYSLGEIAVSDYSLLGGLLVSSASSFYQNTTITNSFYAGTILNQNNSSGSPLIASNPGKPATVSGNVWDSSLLPFWSATSPYGTGLNTATLQNGTPYSGWDTNIWSFSAGSYPLHKNLPGISQPTQLVATPASASVALSWSAPAQNLTGGYVSYSIYRGTQAGSETLIQSGVTGTSWVDSAANNPSLPPASGQLYYYRVRAEGNGIPSGYSTRVSVTPL